MLEANYELMHGIEELIRSSVTSTIAVMFNIPIEVCRDVGKSSFKESYVCCGEFSQDDTKATLMFSFDRELIKKLTHRIFPAASAEGTGMYESTAIEIVNIVGNHLKSHLNVHGYKLHLGIPYLVDNDKVVLVENPLIHLAFSLKDDSAMGVDFYLRTA